MPGQPAVRNAIVLQQFARRERAHAANLISNGINIISYGWYTLAIWRDGTVIVRKGELYSHTTKRHMRELLNTLSGAGIRWVYSNLDTPKEQGEINFRVGCSGMGGANWWIPLTTD